MGQFDGANKAQAFWFYKSPNQAPSEIFLTPEFFDIIY